MRYIHFVILLLISCFFGACREKEDIREGGISFYFHPRECQSITTGTCVLTGQRYNEWESPNVDSSGVEASNLGLWMMTGEKNLSKLITKEPHRELSYLERRYQDVAFLTGKAPRLYRLEKNSRTIIWKNGETAGVHDLRDETSYMLCNGNIV